MTIKRHGGRRLSLIALLLLAAATNAAPAVAQTTDPAADSIYMSAARSAWRFANKNYVTATGLTRPFETYPVATMWDVASGIAALHSARLLGLVGKADYETRMKRTLKTLAGIPLFEDKYFNKEYNTETGTMIGLTRKPSRQGFGTSAIDTGRLLTWLRIIRDYDPQFAADADHIVARIAIHEYLDDEYLQGRQLSRRTGRARSFQEGRIGYEQYSARGFALWGASAERALDINRNSHDEEVEGVIVPGDKRGADRLTSEPFVLSGLESGWNADMRAAATAVLEAQRRRYLRTHILTAVSEDALNIAPDYFYYFLVLSKRGPWTVDVQRPRANITGPRWVSSKAALGWFALQPTSYTKLLATHVAQRAIVGGVWGAGVFENGRPTGNANINTAAGILEAAAYRKLGRPIRSNIAPGSGSSASGR